MIAQLYPEYGKRRAGGCNAADCPNPVHAKGYCRKHYGQIWRRGMIYATPDRSVRIAKSTREERERELRRLKRLRDLSTSLESRLRWRREIRAVEDAMMREGV